MNKPRFRSQKDRDLMVLVLAMDPSVSKALREMFRMGVRNIRHDHMYIYNPRTGQHDYLPDPTAWSGDINPHVGIMMLRGTPETRNEPGAEWWLNGF